MPIKFKEKITRSVAKLITWRIINLIVTFLLGYLSTGSISRGLTVMGVALVINSTVYYIHERIWNKIDLGKNTLKMEEKLPRSAIKLITWRIAVSGNNFFLGYLATGKVSLGLAWVVGAMIINSTTYFFHERIWNRFNWGKFTISEPVYL